MLSRLRIVYSKQTPNIQLVSRRHVTYQPKRPSTFKPFKKSSIRSNNPNNVKKQRDNRTWLESGDDELDVETRIDIQEFLRDTLKVEVKRENDKNRDKIENLLHSMGLTLDLWVDHRKKEMKDLEANGRFYKRISVMQWIVIALIVMLILSDNIRITDRGYQEIFAFL